jgi:SNF2 family DNA or RNA helicase
MSTNKNQDKKKVKSPKQKKQEVPYHKKPAHLSVDKWQRALRKQFAIQNPFEIEKITQELVFADYEVRNPQSKTRYKVALRSAVPGANYCDCFDFKVNQLGTCKHIEAVLEYVRRKRLTRYLKTPEQREYSSVFIDYLDNRAICLRIGTIEEDALINLALDYFDDQLSLTEYGLEHFDAFWTQAKAITPDIRCYEDALERILELRGQQRRIQIIHGTNQRRQFTIFHGLLQYPLLHYQQEGVLFAYQHGRAIIGDEMGLGKTIQAIAAAELFRRENHIEKVLILCPTTLKYQWKTEIEKFTGKSSIQIIEGNALNRKKQYTESSKFYHIAGYHTALFDWEEMNHAKYDLILLDEAQRLKNWRTKIAQAVRRVQSKYALVLTGTPIENNLDELYGLVQLVDPFILGPRHHFFPRFQITEDNGRVIGYKNLNSIRQILSNRLIRRTKKEVLSQLPMRTDRNLLIPMTREQSELHREYGDQVAKLVAKWRRFGFLDEQERKSLLRFLNMMRMVCDSTYILDQSTNFQTKIDELQYLVQDILEIEGEKIVIFSQWAKMNQLVAQMLETMGVGFRYLHGDVPAKDRGKLYEDFNASPEVRVFLSTDAGGVGLNLQSAAWLFNLDVPWNPGILEQRIGRIYRMGQEKPVQVINLISQGSIEQNLLHVLHFKRSMAAGVLDAGDDSIFLGDEKFQKFMESVEHLTSDQHLEDTEAQPAFSSDEADMPEPAALPDETGDELQEDSPAVAKQTTSRETSRNQPQPDPIQKAAAPSPQQLIQDGLAFIGQLANVLKDRESTERLVEQLLEKDADSGQTFLKIPVQNEEVIKGAFQVLGAMLQKLTEKSSQ